MRIVISGTHASGKSTLLSDFALAHPEYAQLSDPFDLIDDTAVAASAASFFRQLTLSADRLRELSPGASVVAERGPLDFLAYLAALAELERSSTAPDLMERGYEIAASAFLHVDLLVLLPLNAADHIWVPNEEDLELRAEMDAQLFELSDDPDIIGDGTRIVEITGDRSQRLAALESAIAASTARHS